MVKLANSFRYFRPFKALVLGDFMLDTYTSGKVSRISPEAPVPVMQVFRQESRPGGAGNVVLNLIALGAQVSVLGRIGADVDGKILKQHLLQADTNCLWIEPDYRTPVKNRLIAESQQLLRIDFETIQPLCLELEKKAIRSLRRLISQVDVVAISDYGKGFLTENVIQAALRIGKELGVPTIIDPKGSDFQKYRGSTVLKPNSSEAYAAAKCPPYASLDEVANRLLDFTDILLITRSELGISVFRKDRERIDFPVRFKEVKDVTGAGDTVLSMICLGLASGLDIQLTAQLANIAAGLSIERIGCVQITLCELAQRLLELDCDGKIFEEHQLYALQQVLQDKQYSLLVLEPNQSMSNALFKVIRELSSLSHRRLILYMQNREPGDELVHLLSSLKEVSYIILQTENLKHLCQVIQPAEVFIFQKDTAIVFDLAKDLLDSLLDQYTDLLHLTETQKGSIL